MKAVVALVVLIALFPTAATAADRTRVIAVIDESVAFDRTVAAPVDTDATLNVLMAAQDAARRAGAAELDIATGTTVTKGLVEVNVLTNGQNMQSGDNASAVVQSGSAQSGDAIDGQVISVTGSGTVEQTNTSANNRTRTGSSSGSNTSG